MGAPRAGSFNRRCSSRSASPCGLGPAVRSPARRRRGAAMVATGVSARLGRRDSRQVTAVALAAWALVAWQTPRFVSGRPREGASPLVALVVRAPLPPPLLPFPIKYFFLLTLVLHYDIAGYLMRNYGQHNALLAGIRAARGDDRRHARRRPPEPARGDPEAAREARRGLRRRLRDGRRAAVSASGATSARADEARAALGDRRATTSRQGERVPRVSHRAPRRVRRLRGAVRLDRRPALVGDDALRCGPGRARGARGGRSSYSFGRLATHALNVMTGFSTRPLRIASLVGLVFTLFGVVVLVVVLVTYVVEGGSVAGLPVPRLRDRDLLRARSC